MQISEMMNDPEIVGKTEKAESKTIADSDYEQEENEEDNKLDSDENVKKEISLNKRNKSNPIILDDEKKRRKK